MCNFAFDIESVLEDQPSYYLDGYNQIKKNLTPRVVELADAMSLQANYTLSDPLAKQFKTTALI